jgi:hypothetical protein
VAGEMLTVAPKTDRLATSRFSDARVDVEQWCKKWLRRNTSLSRPFY